MRVCVCVRYKGGEGGKAECMRVLGDRRMNKRYKAGVNAYILQGEATHENMSV